MELGKLKHEYILPKEKFSFRPGRWITDVGIPTVWSYELLTNQKGMPDLRKHRWLLADELALASNPARFYEFYDDPKHKPTEFDRKAFITHLCFLTSFTGLLHSTEIVQLIGKNAPWIAGGEFMPKEVTVPSYEEQKHQLRQFKAEGYKLVGFQGAFDAPTSVHMANATDACQIVQEYDQNAKIVFLLDNDELIQRKKTDTEQRPRFPVVERQAVLLPFWQTGAAIESKVNQISTDDFAAEYQDLGLDFMLLTPNPKGTRQEQEELVARNATARKAGIKVVWGAYPEGTHSSEVIRQLQRK